MGQFQLDLVKEMINRDRCNGLEGLANGYNSLL